MMSKYFLFLIFLRLDKVDIDIVCRNVVLVVRVTTEILYFWASSFWWELTTSSAIILVCWTSRLMWVKTVADICLSSEVYSSCVWWKSIACIIIILTGTRDDVHSMLNNKIKKVTVIIFWVVLFAVGQVCNWNIARVRKRGLCEAVNKKSYYCCCWYKAHLMCKHLSKAG